MADGSGVSQTSLELLLEFDNTYDDTSSNNRDQSPEIGAASYASDGAVGQAAKFRYADRNHIDTGVNALGSADLYCGSSNPFTLSTFLRFNGDSAFGAGTICARQQGTGAAGVASSNFFLHVTTDRKLLVRLRGQDNYFTPTMHDGAWHHVGVTWDNTTATVYFDGVSIGTASVGNVAENTVNIFIGGSSLPDITGLPTSNLVGQLDDFRVYSRALTAGEIGLLAGYGSVGDDPVVEPDDLELYLKLEDDYLDSSGNDRHQTANVAGSPVFVTGKVHNKALRFDGTDDFIGTTDSAMGDATLYHGTGDTWSAMAWIRLGATDAGGDFIARERNSPNVGGFRMVAGTSGYDIYLGGTQNSYTQGTIDDGEWHHIAVTFDDGASPKAVVYYDGVAETTPTVGSEGDGTVDITIGGRRIGGSDPGDPGGFFDGDLDDVRLYGRTLTPSEIAAIVADSANTGYDATLTLTAITGAVASLRVVFGRSVTGFTAGDVTATGGTAGNAAGSGTTWTFDVTATGNGVITAKVNANAVDDGNGEGNTESNTISWGIGGVAGGGSGLSRFDRTVSPTHTASVLVGPVAIAPNSCERSIVAKARAVFGSGTTATGNFLVATGLDGEDAVTRADNDAHQFETTLTSLMNNHGLCFPRAGGSAAIFQIDVTSGHLTLENIDVFLEPAGRNTAARYEAP